jgi:hypothetical protein
MIVACVLLLLAVFCVEVYAQEQRTQRPIVAELIAGESGYEMPVMVSNRNVESIQSVQVDVTAVPEGFTNVSIEPSRIDELAPGETTIFLLRFDVDVEAQAQPYTEIALAIQAYNAEFNDPEPVIGVAIAAPATTRRLPVFRLVSAGTSKQHDNNRSYICTQSTGALGATCSYEREVRWGSQSRGTEKYQFGAGFTHVPLEIVLGEPFSLKGEVSVLSSFSSDHQCHANNIGAKNDNDRWYCLSNSEVLQSPVGKIGISPASLGDGYVLDLPGTTSFTINYEPLECLLSTGVLFSDAIACDSAQAKKTMAAEHEFFTIQYTYRVVVDLKGRLRSGAEEITFYLGGDVVRNTNAQGIVEPLEGLAAEDADRLFERVENTHQTFELEFIDRLTQIRYQPALSGGNYLSRVQAYRRSGFFGGGLNESVTGTGASAATDDTKKSKVPRLAGLSIHKAGSLVESAGLKPVFELGPKAKTSQQNNTVARQSPAPGTEIKPGSEVSIFIFARQTEGVGVPDLAGMPVVRAKAVLMDKGLSISAELGQGATNGRDAGRVYKQSPEAGAVVSEGAAVLVWIYGNFAKQQQPSVPDKQLPTPGKPNWDKGCTLDNSGGATLQWSLRDLPPYSGLTHICSDRDGKTWILGNHVPTIILGDPDPRTGCYPRAVVKASNRDYRGTLCRPRDYAVEPSVKPVEPQSKHARETAETNRKFDELLRQRAQQRSAQPTGGEKPTTQKSTTASDGNLQPNQGSVVPVCHCRDARGPYWVSLGMDCSAGEFFRNYDCE